MSSTKKQLKLINKEVVAIAENDVVEIINEELEKAIKAKAEELGKKYYRNITVRFGAIIE